MPDVWMVAGVIIVVVALIVLIGVVIGQSFAIRDLAAALDEAQRRRWEAPGEVEK